MNKLNITDAEIVRQVEEGKKNERSKSLGVYCYMLGFCTIHETIFVAYFKDEK